MAGWHFSLLMIGTWTFFRVFAHLPPSLSDPQPDTQQRVPVPFWKKQIHGNIGHLFTFKSSMSCWTDEIVPTLTQNIPGTLHQTCHHMLGSRLLRGGCWRRGRWSCWASKWWDPPFRHESDLRLGPYVVCWQLHNPLTFLPCQYFYQTQRCEPSIGCKIDINEKDG